MPKPYRFRTSVLRGVHDGVSLTISIPPTHPWFKEMTEAMGDVHSDSGRVFGESLDRIIWHLRREAGILRDDPSVDLRSTSAFSQ